MDAHPGAGQDPRGLAIRLRRAGARGLLDDAKGGASTVTVSGSTLTIYASQPPGGSGGQEARTCSTPSSSRSSRRAARPASSPSSSSSSTVTSCRTTPARRSRTRARSPTSASCSRARRRSRSRSPTSRACSWSARPTPRSYLTQPVPPPVSSSPASYYPARSTYGETFARVVPNSGHRGQGDRRRDAGPARLAAVRLQRRRPVRRGDRAGGAQDAKAAGLTLVSSRRGRRRRLLRRQRRQPAPRARPPPTRSTRPPRRARARSCSCRRGSTTTRSSPGSARARRSGCIVSSPGFLPKHLPPRGGRSCRTSASSFGHAPVPQAIFGYEAMSALLYVLEKAGAQANKRATVVNDFRQLKNPPNSVDRPLLDQRRRSEHRAVHLRRVRGGKLVPFKFVQLQGERPAACTDRPCALPPPWPRRSLSGCGSVRAETQNKIGGERLTIYVSVPLYGASSVSGQAVVARCAARARCGPRADRRLPDRRSRCSTTPTSRPAPGIPA